MSEAAKALAGRLERVPARFLATRRADIHTTSLVSQFGYANRQLNSMVRELLLLSRLGAGATAVDFGCADRPYATFLPAGVQYLGADLPGNAEADVAIGPDGTLPIPQGTVDLVLSTQVLEHVEDPGRYLAECARLLRPGGKLLLSTHGIMYYHPDPEDYWRWTCAGIRRLLGDHGFEVIESKGVLGLIAASLQLIQDRIAWRLPRYVRRLFIVTMQILIALGDRIDKEESKSTNSWTIAVLASKVS